jgi:hypothetical protein
MSPKSEPAAVSLAVDSGGAAISREKGSSEFDARSRSGVEIETMFDTSRK